MELRRVWGGGLDEKGDEVRHRSDSDPGQASELTVEKNLDGTKEEFADSVIQEPSFEIRRQIAVDTVYSLETMVVHVIPLKVKN